jgi:endonuclease/exonuclease/phosphatase family metal-dependent hydrolase
MNVFRPLATLLATLLALPLAAQTYVPPAATLRLGTWNLEFLGAEGDFRSKLPLRDDADYRALGAKVKDLGVHVLAVQEINDEASLQRVAAAAGPSWRVLLGTSGSWDDGKTAQRVGFVWDGTALELLAAEELLELPREVDGVPIFHRVPVVACFRHKATGFDFRAVTVHLKAGQKPADEQKRKLEAKALHQWFAALAVRPREDQDVVLLGDFNSTYTAEPELILEQGGVLRYLDQTTPSPTIQHFAEPIDQIVVGRGFDEVQAATFRAHTDHGGMAKEAWRKTYSDHYPVTVDVLATADADPDAHFTTTAEHALPVARRPTGAPVAPHPTRNRGAAATPSWPPRVGTAIVLHVQDGPDLQGVLAAPLPEGPGGWIALEIHGELRAVPRERVTGLHLPR